MQSFTVDATAPDTAINSGPEAPTTSHDAEFAFSSAEPDATFECRLDARRWRTCSSPSAYTDVRRGRHTFDVRGLDPYGNADASPASQRWSVRRPRQYRPRRYALLAGQIYGNRGGIRRLYRNDGRRMEVVGDAKRLGPYVSAFKAFTSIRPAEVATLRSITLRYNGGATAPRTAVALHVFSFRSRRWVKAGRRKAGPRDRSVEWSASAASNDYVSSRGTVRVRLKAKRRGAFRMRTDLVRLTVHY